MKKLFFLLLLVPLLSFNSGEGKINIVGKWKGEDKKEIGYMIFDSDGYASIEMGEQTVGGKEFVLNGKKGSMTYSINLDTVPVNIDLIITQLETKKQMKMLYIAKYLDEKTMILASNFNSERPIEFNSDNSIKMHRVE